MMRIGTGIKIAFATLIIGLIAGGVGGYFLFDLDGRISLLTHSSTDRSSIYPSSPVMIPVGSDASFDIFVKGNYEGFSSFSLSITLYSLPISEYTGVFKEYFMGAFLESQTSIGLIVEYNSELNGYGYTWTPEVVMEENLLYCLRSNLMYKQSDADYLTIETAVTFIAVGSEPTDPASGWEKFIDFMRVNWIPVLCFTVVGVSLITVVTIVAVKYKKYRKKYLKK